MKYLESFSDYEPHTGDLEKWIDYLSETYKLEIEKKFDKQVKFVMIDEKPRDITGPFAKKGELVDLIFYEIVDSKSEKLKKLPEIHEPTVRKAIKDWIEQCRKLDIDFAISKIKEQFPFSKVKELLDAEIREWSPEDEDESYYKEHSNGEAEDAIITKIVDWYATKYPSSYSENDESILKQSIKNSYDFL